MKPFKPYSPCIGRKYRLIPKLYRPFAILLGVNLCNMHLTEKNSLRCIKQILRLFYKSRYGYHISNIYTNINEEIVNIQEGSIITLSTRAQKSALKKLFEKLNYEIIDYKILKRRQYLLNISFLFLDIKDIINPKVSLDIICETTDIFNIFIIINGFFFKDFYNILYYYKIFLNNKPKLKYYKNLNEDLNEIYFFDYYNLLVQYIDINVF